MARQDGFLGRAARVTRGCPASRAARDKEETRMIRKQEIDTLSKKMGGRFKMTVLIQKRIQELVRGASPLVALDKERKQTIIDIAIEEVVQGKVCFEPTAEDEESKTKKKKD
jgi:DNA-directed RNA polymerase subunit omega